MTRLPPFKVAFLISSFNRGGMELRLLDVLQHIDKAQIDAFLFVAKGGGQLLAELDDHRVYVGTADGRNILRSLAMLWRALRHERPDVVWCVGQGWLGFVGRICAMFLKTPVIILSLHGRQRDSAAIMEWYNRLITRVTTDKLVVLSQHYADRLRAYGFAESLMAVQYNGTDPERYYPSADREKQKSSLLAIDPSRPVIGTVGNLRSVKAQEVIIEAAPHVLQVYPDALFIIIGEGRCRSYLEQLTRQRDVADAVRFLGGRDDVPALLRAMDVFVLTSDNGEGFSNVILEALASGLPVITTDFGGADEAVDDSVGVIVPRRDHRALADAICQLLNDPIQREAMGQAARQRIIEKFSLATMIAEREALIMDLLEQKGVFGRR